MLEDQNTKAKIVLTTFKVQWLENIISTKIIVLSDVVKTLDEEDADNLNLQISSLNLSYAIFTSGSTGLPKGVMVQHQGMVNHIYCKINDLHVDSSDIVAQTSTQIFDISIWQMLASLTIGAKVIFFSDLIIKDPKQFVENITRESVTILQLVPLYVHSLALYMQLSTSNNFKFLRYLIITGEALQNQVCQEIFKVNNNIVLVNAYGPTECSDDITHYHCNFNQFVNFNFLIIPIGRVLQNLKVYVLNANLNSLPIGAIGELYVGGVGVARGYLNRPDLTMEKFIANPFQSDEERADKSYGNSGRNARLYKTGDLVRWLPDGNLEYIGRNDFQVKLRGYRIELGEIESTLLEYEGIKQSVVLAREHTNVINDNLLEDSTYNKYLIGYYVSERKLDEAGILKYLQNRLPEYMVPSVLVHLEQLPLTINGKLDRKALPDPEFGGDADNYVAPRDEVEGEICKIWAEVLRLPEEKVGIYDNFFRLGGDSIVSIQLVSRLRQRLGLNVSVKDIFTYRTIEKLYDNILIQGANYNAASVIQTEQGLLGGEFPLLPIQEWFFNRDFSNINYFNQSFIIKVPSLDIEKLKRSLIKLIDYHDAFRLKYRKGSEGYTQYYAIDGKVEELRILDIKTLEVREGSKEFSTELENIFTDWQSCFNIEEGPLYSIGYIHGYSDGSSRIYFALHHLIIDAVSWRILVEDLEFIYNGGEVEKKRTSYRQWVDTIRKYTDFHREEKNYWSNVLEESKEFNSELSGIIDQNKLVNYGDIVLTSKETVQLLQNSNKVYNTQINDILLTALAYALKEVTGSNISYIALEGHGREDIDNTVDVTRTVGWFTTMYPVRLELKEDLGDSIKNIKETLRQIPNKGIGCGAIIGYKDKNILSKISFNYLGQFNNESNQLISNDLINKSSNFWHIVNDNSGIMINTNNQDSNIISINGMVIGGVLKFNIESKLTKEITAKITISLKDQLKKIIDHTTSRSRSYLTVSDLIT